MVTEPLPKIDVVARAEALDGLVAELVELSHPLFSYTELKSMLRSHYHRHVSECIDAGLASRELAAVAGLTKPGLRGLDDARPFRMRRNALRMLYVWIKDAGESGASRGELAQRYYDELSPQARKNVGLSLIHI